MDRKDYASALVIAPLVALALDASVQDGRGGDGRQEPRAEQPAQAPERALASMRASRWLERDVQTTQQKTLGAISDLVIDVGDPRIAYAIVELDDELARKGDGEDPDRPEGAIGAQLTAIPWRALRVNAPDAAVAVNVDPLQLRQLPRFAAQSWPTFADRVWGEKVHQALAVRPYWSEPEFRGRALEASAWLQGGEYGKRFDPKSLQTVRGKIVSVARTAPLSGMSKGVQIAVQPEPESGAPAPPEQSPAVVVQLGPVWYVANHGVALVPGAQVTVRGSKVSFDRDTALMAVELSVGDQRIVLRDDTGRPAWSGWIREGAAAEDAQLLRLSELRGAAVNARGDQAVGKLDDLIVNARTGEVHFAVLTAGGGAGLGEKRIAVPLASLAIESGDGKAQIGLAVDPQELDRLPGYQDERDLADPDEEERERAPREPEEKKGD